MRLQKVKNMISNKLDSFFQKLFSQIKKREDQFVSLMTDTRNTLSNLTEVKNVRTHFSDFQELQKMSRIMKKDETLDRDTLYYKQFNQMKTTQKELEDNLHDQIQTDFEVPSITGVLPSISFVVNDCLSQRIKLINVKKSVLEFQSCSKMTQKYKRWQSNTRGGRSPSESKGHKKQKELYDLLKKIRVSKDRPSSLGSFQLRHTRLKGESESEMEDFRGIGESSVDDSNNY